jgi:CRISPR/Cas system-associated protein Cas7 (RAMP superfamily)
MEYRWDEALKYFPNIKDAGLTVCDYNCTWYVNAERVDKKLKILHDKLATAKSALNEILEFHFYGKNAEKFKKILGEL